MSYAKLLPYQIQFLEILKSEKSIANQTIDILIIEHELTGIPIENLTYELHFLTETEVLSIISKMNGKKYIDVSDTKYKIHANALETIGITNAKQMRILPIIDNDDNDKYMTIAISHTNDISIYDRLRAYFPNIINIKIVIASEKNILARLNNLIENNHNHDIEFDSPFLDQLLEEAISIHASDIHFEPNVVFIKIRYRVAGILKDTHLFHQKFWSSLCVRIKVLSGMDIAESRRPQDGRFSMNILGKNIDFRVSSHPTIYGESIVIRILDKSFSLLSIENLGYKQDNISIIKKCVKKPDGMVIMTGPTGSGKTTSLYAMLSMLDANTTNIMTLEEPVEYKIPNIRQSEIKETISFVDGMRSILRQDPDVILIGEIRDKETAHIAMRAVMTGHKVFTTLHTNDALSAIYRFFDFDISISLIAGNISTIIAQRLIRVLCEYCKEHDHHNIYNVFYEKVIYKAVGCKKCNGSGYNGRQAVCEIIIMDHELEHMLLYNRKASYKKIAEYLDSKGFKSLLTSGIELVLDGKTSVSELQRVIGISQ